MTSIFNSDGIGPGIDVPAIEEDAVRTGTKSGYDLAYWAMKFIVDGTPRDYNTIGPEGDGTALIAWAASKVGVSFPDNYDLAVQYLSNSQITVDEALRKRGALLVCANRISVSAGLDNVIDVIDGRHFLYKSVPSPQTPNTCRFVWQYGALIPGVIYK